MYKTPQIAEEQLVVMMESQRNKASKMQKLAFSCFLLTSAKVKKFQYGNRSIRLYTVIFLQLRSFPKIATIYQKDSRSFQQWVKQKAKRSILQDYEVTHRHTGLSTKMVTEKISCVIDF